MFNDLFSFLVLTFFKSILIFLKLICAVNDMFMRTLLSILDDVRFKEDLLLLTVRTVGFIALRYDN